MELKLTTKSQEALSAAVQQATAAGNPHVEPAHVLAALTDQPGGVAVGLLEAVGARPDVVAQRARALVAAMPSASGSSVAPPQLSRPALTVMQTAQQEMQALSRNWKRTLALLVPGVIAGIAFAFAVLAWLDSSGVTSNLVAQGSAELGSGSTDLLRVGLTGVIGAALGAALAPWLARLAD